jgi:hypothetical protein
MKKIKKNRVCCHVTAIFFALVTKVYDRMREIVMSGDVCGRESSIANPNGRTDFDAEILPPKMMANLANF